jgi:dihydroneopterin aldolase
LTDTLDYQVIFEELKSHVLAKDFSLAVRVVTPVTGCITEISKKRLKFFFAITSASGKYVK